MIAAAVDLGQLGVLGHVGVDEAVGAAQRIVGVGARICLTIIIHRVRVVVVVVVV